MSYFDDNPASPLQLAAAVSYFDGSPLSPLQLAAAATPYGEGHSNAHHGYDGARIGTHTKPRQKPPCMAGAVAILPEVLQVPVDGLLHQVHTKTASQITVTFCRAINVDIHMETTCTMDTT